MGYKGVGVILYIAIFFLLLTGMSIAAQPEDCNAGGGIYCSSGVCIAPEWDNSNVDCTVSVSQNVIISGTNNPSNPSSYYLKSLTINNYVTLRFFLNRIVSSSAANGQCASGGSSSNDWGYRLGGVFQADFLTAGYGGRGGHGGIHNGDDDAVGAGGGSGGAGGKMFTAGGAGGAGGSGSDCDDSDYTWWRDNGCITPNNNNCGACKTPGGEGGRAGANIRLIVKQYIHFNSPQQANSIISVSGEDGATGGFGCSNTGVGNGGSGAGGGGGGGGAGQLYIHTTNITGYGTFTAIGGKGARGENGQNGRYDANSAGAGGGGGGEGGNRYILF
jgi:hypothetical protein